MPGAENAESAQETAHRFDAHISCRQGYQLDAVYHWSDLLEDKKIAAVEILRRIVVQQFYVNEKDIHWRTGVEGIPPSIIFINSPYDLDAHYGKKRQFQWTGYKVYLTETCDEELPRLSREC